jgi:hypothetical protein
LDILIDFITDLSFVEEHTFIIIITNRLFKGIIFQLTKAITAEIVAKELFKCFIQYHGIF